MAIRKTVKKDAAVEAAKVAETPGAVKAEAAAPKAEKAAPVKAAAAKAVKKAAAPKAPKAAAVTSEVYVQYGVMEWKVADLTEKAKAAYAAEGNTDAVASVKLYIKP